MEAGEKKPGDLTILLGWNLHPENTVLNKPYIIYQLEPLALPLWQDKLAEKRNLFKEASALWDYSPSNIQYLNASGFDAEVVPLAFHPKLKEITAPKFCDYDILFVGFLTERRRMVIERLNQHCCVSIQPRWGKEFMEALGRSKILLNIHQYAEPTPLEQPRIAYALNNQSFVITENSIDDPYPGIVTCNYDRIVDTTLHFLTNPNKRAEVKKSFFEKFEKIKMEDILKTHLDNLAY